MDMRFQTVIRAVAGIGMALILAACTEDVGVDQHGRKVAAERLDGQWLVINYWAEWCGPCRTEIPELNALARQHAAHVAQASADALFIGDGLAPVDGMLSLSRRAVRVMKDNLVTIFGGGGFN